MFLVGANNGKAVGSELLYQVEVPVDLILIIENMLAIVVGYK
jgi:hypothetical protein